MSNTREQDRVLSRLNARELSAEEREAVTGGFVLNTGVCTIGPAPNFQTASTDGDCPVVCPT
ncbi:MAG TPA: hypothetical protein VFP59_02335 [Candidatus Angelobacter sp.]|nr:hypothetical protein [Candidatus Angelobacter sp.]